MIFTKNKEGVGAVRVMKYKKYVAGKYTRARAPLVRNYTNRIFESKDGTKSMKIVNYIERHNFFWNDLLTKSNRTEIQPYKVEERTFGTPCITFLTVRGRVLSQTLKTRRLYMLSFLALYNIKTFSECWSTLIIMIYDIFASQTEHIFAIYACTKEHFMSLLRAFW